MAKKHTFNKTALTLLNGAYKDRTKLVGDGLNSVQSFLESAIGNIHLNSFLRSDKANELDIHPALKQGLMYISYKTRNINLDEAEEIIQKMNRAQEAVKAGKPIADEDKVTLKEFAIILDVAKTTTFLNVLDRAGFIQGNKKLEQLHKIAAEGEKLITGLEKEIERELTTVGPGTILFENTEKSSTLKRVALTFAKKAMTYFTKHEHTSVLHVENNKPVTSEITHAYKPKSFDVDIADHLKADTYKIDLSALVPKEQHELMESTYGKSWKEIITTKYKLIENDIHGSKTQSRFGDLRAASGGGITQVKAGLANLVPFGHKQVKENDFEEIHRKVMSNHYATHAHPTMLCSEFSGVTTIAALVELNKQIKQDIGAKKDELGMVRSVPETVVKIPFGKHENLHKLHPSRLLKVLQEHGCVEKVKVKTDEYFKEAINHGKKAQKHLAKASGTQSLPAKSRSQEKGLSGIS